MLYGSHVSSSPQFLISGERITLVIGCNQVWFSLLGKETFIHSIEVDWLLTCGHTAPLLLRWLTPILDGGMESEHLDLFTPLDFPSYTDQAYLER